MPFAIEYQRLPSHVRVAVSGPASLKNYFDLFELAGRSTRMQGTRRVLLDLRGVIGRLSFTDQFYIGEVVGDKFTHIERVAVLVTDDPDSYTTGKVANRKGANLRTFSEEDAAVAWLVD